MDSFMSSNSLESEEEERLYCSAPQREDDIIWAGSDTEESAEEIERKRRRYEYHAESYLRGQLPVLQSAGLKGPFAQDWVNPWRYRQRKMPPKWWKPGSKDMLFTRANVLKRAADHGMGHLKPIEALAWCKAEAKAEAEVELRVEQREAGIERASSKSESNAESDAPSDLEDQYPVPTLGLGLQNDGSGDMRMDIPTKPALPNSQILINRRDIEVMDEGLHTRRRDIKRSADSQWLKGSYVSKRAKGDAPTMSSPTPMQDFHAERDRRRSQSSARPPKFRDEAPYMSNPTTPLSHEAQIMDPLHPFSESTTHSGAHISNLTNARSLLRDSYSTGPQLTDDPGIHSHQGKDIPYPDSQETTFDSAVTHFEKRKLQNKPFSSRYPSLFLTEPHDVSTPVVERSLIAMTSSAQLDTSKASYSPTLSRSYAGSNPGFPEDISFITEIAPSSRDLEQFQYRKKRRRSSRQDYTNSNEELHDQRELISCASPKPDETLDIGSEPLHEQVGKSPSDSDIPDDEAENSIDTPQSQSKPHQGQAESPTSTLPSGNTALPAEDAGEDNDTPKYRHSDSSWDLLDDIDVLDINIAVCGSGSVEEVPRQSSPDRGLEHERSLSANKQPADRKSQSSQRESVAIRLSQMSFALIEVPEDLVARKTVESFYVPNPVDESTQSYNTTPMSSLHSLHKRTPASIKHPQRMKTAIEGEEISNAAFPLTQDLQIIAGDSTPSVDPEGLCSEKTRPQNDKLIETADDMAASHQDKLNPVQMRQSGLSPDCDISSRTSSQCTPNDQDILPHGSFKEEAAGVQSNAPGGLESPRSPQDEGQASWQRGASQSPWAPATVDSVTIHGPWKSIQMERFVTPESEESGPEESAKMGTSAERDGSVDYSDWQRVDPPSNPAEHDCIKPFKDFMTPTPSPEPSGPISSEGDVSNTQILLDSVVNNPWTSSFRNPTSGKSKKRVSFGVPPSEGLGNSQLDISSSKQVPGPPPLPRSVEHLHREDIFDDVTVTVNKFDKHFMTTGGVKRILSEVSNSQFLETSPAVGAMAEAFIAADRETSAERDHHVSPKSPSRHLKAIGQARANITPFDFGHLLPTNSSSRRQSSETVGNHRTIDHDIGDDLDEFIGSAGGFLEEWSVETELKKTEPAKSTKSSIDSGGRRSMFGFTSRW